MGSYEVCHKCAVRFDPVCANSLPFNTRPNCSRAGLVVGKLLTLKGGKTWKARSYSPTLNQSPVAFILFSDLPLNPFSDSGFSGCDINSDHIQVVAGGFESLLSIMVRNKSGVIIKGCIALPAEPIKDDQEPSMFLVDARPHEIDDGDVVARLTSRTESMAEHEPQRSFEHCFVGLLKASLLVKGENFVSRGEFLIRAREKAFTLRPINGVRLYFLHLNLRAEYAYCARRFPETHPSERGAT